MNNKDDEIPPDWPDDRWMTREEAARYARGMGLRLQPATLAKYAWAGRGGPPFKKFGGKAYYQVGAFKAWLEARLSG